MPVIPTYKLIYFDFEGRAEITRIMFHEAGVQFEDCRIKIEDWPKHKNEMPMGQIPVLEFNGKMLCQTDAINRFLAKQFGLYGNNDWERAKVDEFCMGVYDAMYIPLRGWFLENDPAKKKELWTEAMKSSAHPFLAKLDKHLEETKKRWLVGDDMTLADIDVYQTFRSFSELPAFKAVGGLDMSGYPHVQQLRERVATRPNIRSYLANKPKSDR